MKKLAMINCDRCGKTIDEENIYIGWADCTICKKCYDEFIKGEKFDTKE